MYEYLADAVTGDMVVSDASHWVFANTGLVNGSTIPGVLGYEADKMQGNSPAGTRKLTNSPWGGSHVSNMTAYDAASGASVVATGAMNFHWALDDWAVAVY